jgi:ribonuclease P protein component
VVSSFPSGCSAGFTRTQSGFFAEPWSAMECEAAMTAATNHELVSSTGGQPYPRSGRLLRHADFERVYKQGRRHFSSHMTVFYFHRGGEQGWRVGFTVSRALGGAVDRNRMKRRLRESVRKTWPQASVPMDVVVNPKKSLLRAPFEDLVAEMRRAFEVMIQKQGGKASKG